MNRLAVLWGAAVVLICTLGPALLEAGNKKGDKFSAQGREAEAKRDYDAALDFYEKALATEASDTGYQLNLRRVRFAAGQMHVDRGQKIRAQGNLEEALAEFRKAFAIDPASAVADQEIRRTNAMIERERKRKEDPNAPQAQQTERGLTPSEVARKDAERRASSILMVPELKPISRQVTSLKMVNQKARVLYETLGKLTGINMLFDIEYQDQRTYSVDLSNTTFDEALDYLALMTKTYVKPLSSNALFITQDNATKRRDYEEQVTRIFYLQNVTSPQEMQEVMTAMRTVTDVRKVFPINSQSAIAVRGSADQVALAEKVLLDLDKPKPEVVVDVLVMEANKNKTRDLAITPVSGGKNGLAGSIAFTPQSGGTTSAVRLGSLSGLNGSDWSVSLPGVLLQALMTDSGTKVLTTPQVRATDGQKASLRLGDRYPYATGSFQPGVGAVGVSPLVSTQFQFAEVGINLDITPRIHAQEEVSMQVEFEISNIRDKVDVGGLSQPVIGQRKVSHIIRVREGEITLIGGLMQATQTKNRSGVPGLMNIPGLGRLFSSESVTAINTDLLVALVPHIVRGPELTAENLRSIATGTESIYKLNYAPPKEEPVPAAKPAAPAPKPAGPGGLPMAPVQPASAQQPPSAPGPDTPASAPPPIQGNLNANPAVPGLGRPTAGPGTPVLALRPSVSEVNQNSSFTVNVQVENVTELFSVPMRVKYDNKTLKLLEVAQGSFLNGDGQQVTFSEAKAEDDGVAIINLNRVPGAGGISGSGTLVTLKFQAINKGTTAINFQDVALRDAKLQNITITPPTTAVTVK